MTVEPELFSITRSTRGGREIVALLGELDMASSPALSNALDALADTASPVVVDLSGLTFIDSSGIHAILRPRPGHGVVLVCPPGNIHRVLSVARIDRVVPLYETLAEALAEHA